MGEKSVSIWVRLEPNAAAGVAQQVKMLARTLQYGEPEVKPGGPWVGFQRHRWAEDAEVLGHAAQFAQHAGDVTCAASVFDSDVLFLVLAGPDGVRSTIHVSTDGAAPRAEALEPWRALLGSDQKLRSLRALLQPGATVSVEEVLPYIGGLVGWRPGVLPLERPPPPTRPIFAIEARPDLRLEGQTNAEASVTVTLYNAGAAANATELHVTGTAVERGLLSIEGAELSGVWDERHSRRPGPPPFSVRLRAARFRPTSPPEQPLEPEAVHATLYALSRKPGEGELLVQLRDPQSQVTSEVVRIPALVRPPEREKDLADQFGRRSNARAISGVLSFRAAYPGGLEAARWVSRAWLRELVATRTAARFRRYAWPPGPIEHQRVWLTPDLSDKRWETVTRPWPEARAVSCVFGVHRGARPETAGSGFSFEWSSTDAETVLNVGLWQDGWGVSDAVAEERSSRLAELFSEVLRDREVLNGVVSVWAYRPTLPLEPTPFEVCFGRIADGLRAEASKLSTAVRAVVSGHLWCGAKLLERLDLAAVSHLAEVKRCAAGVHLRPKSLADLAALETAMLPLDRRFTPH
jgi:hypothetical protein